MALFFPKLLPTVPVQLHVLPAAFFHVAVADWPTFRQVIERFERRPEAGEAEAIAPRIATTVIKCSCIVLIVLQSEILWIYYNSSSTPSTLYTLPMSPYLTDLGVLDMKRDLSLKPD